uniref:VWFA domain-containing protein n=1 Tax=Acrobeloides nanus TaxID=290746 RepID=A0A914ER44_9BILA
MSVKLIAILTFISLVDRSLSDRCPTAGEYVYNNTQSINFVNPGGINSPSNDSCNNISIGYTNQTLGLVAQLQYCVNFSDTDQLIFSNGVYPTVVVDKNLCNQYNSGPVLFNGTTSSIITAQLKQDPGSSPVVFYITISVAKLNIITTSTAAPTTKHYTGPGPNPYSARMDLAIAVDTSFGPGIEFFNNKTKPIINHLVNYLTVDDPPTLQSKTTRLSLITLSPFQNAGGFGLVTPWGANGTYFTQRFNTVDIVPFNSSYYTSVLTGFVQTAFSPSGIIPARNRTQKVLLIFVNSDARPSSDPDDSAGKFGILRNTLESYDVHTVVVNMGSDITNLKAGFTGIVGANQVYYYSYNTAFTSADQVAQDILASVLMNGNALCATSLNSASPINATGNSNSNTTIRVPQANSITNPQQTQAYCNNLDYTYIYTPKSANGISDGVIVSVLTQELAYGPDKLIISNGTEPIASFSGYEVEDAHICINNATNVSISVITQNGHVYSGVTVTFTELNTNCEGKGYPAPYYRRRKRSIE